MPEDGNRIFAWQFSFDDYYLAKTILLPTQSRTHFNHKRGCNVLFARLCLFFSRNCSTILKQWLVYKDLHNIITTRKVLATQLLEQKLVYKVDRYETIIILYLPLSMIYLNEIPLFFESMLLAY
jgi:hypothetical protein